MEIVRWSVLGVPGTTMVRYPLVRPSLIGTRRLRPSPYRDKAPSARTDLRPFGVRIGAGEVHGRHTLTCSMGYRGSESKKVVLYSRDTQGFRVPTTYSTLVHTMH